MGRQSHLYRQRVKGHTSVKYCPSDEVAVVYQGASQPNVNELLPRLFVVAVGVSRACISSRSTAGRTGVIIVAVVDDRIGHGTLQ